MAFPTSPSNEDIYVKDGVSYQYTLAENKWAIIIDPDKIASNIKNGVEIDGVTGTYVASPSLESPTFVAEPASGIDNIYYTKYGNLYVIRYMITGSTETTMSSNLYGTASAQRFCSLLGVSYSSFIEGETTNLLTEKEWDGAAWTSTGSDKYVAAILTS